MSTPDTTKAPDLVETLRKARADLEAERKTLIEARDVNDKHHVEERTRIDDRLDEIRRTLGGDRPPRKPRKAKTA